MTRIGESELNVAITGIANRKLQGDLQQLFAIRPDICITTGLAGGLKSQHRVGTILVAKSTGSDQPGTSVDSDESLMNAAVECGATVVDRFHTSSRLIESAEAKARLSGTADACEMEGFHIMYEAHRRGVPAVAIRAISDPLEQNLPLDFAKVMDDRGSINWFMTLSELTKAPHRLGAFMSFGLESRRAARILALFLNRYVPFVLASPVLETE
jgi:nucleoside phosphorylase